MGYTGIVVMMFLEASFFPFPSEVSMIPAGYFISQGKMTFFMAIGAGILGSILGSSLNYFLGKYLGREFLSKYGKYVFISHEKLEKMDILFKEKGKSIVFFGRLIPVVRQYISFPPGISNMNFYVFMFLTGLGSSIWVTFLVLLGYFYGDNQSLINNALNNFKYLCIILLIIGFSIFIYNKFKNKSK
ncbi:DedA family protein [Cetobacterium sp. 2A]|nr:DedA family protein [Cetobacterium sp. 2A]